jgi:hypothetical protein
MCNQEGLLCGSWNQPGLTSTLADSGGYLCCREAGYGTGLYQPPRSLQLTYWSVVSSITCIIILLRWGALSGSRPLSPRLSHCMNPAILHSVTISPYSGLLPLIFATAFDRVKCIVTLSVLSVEILWREICGGQFASQSSMSTLSR